MLSATRLRNPGLFNRLMSAEEAVQMIRDGMTVAFGGFTAIGCPKAVPQALARSVESGRKMKLTILSGGSVGQEVENDMAGAGVIARRSPGTLAVYKHMADGINSGQIAYYDYHYSHMPQMVNYGFLGPIDIAIVEAAAITSDGNIVPTTSVGGSPSYARLAKKLIVEVNTTQPLELEGMHDVYIPASPPNRKPIPIDHTGDRIGSPYIEAGIERISAIVETIKTDPAAKPADPDNLSKQIAEHLIDFLHSEIRAGRLPPSLLPLQSGFGNIGNAVLAGFADSDFNQLEFFTELAQPALVDLVDSGKVKVVSCSALSSDPRTIEKIRADPVRYRKAFVLRPLEISNHPEVIRRLGVIAVNTPLEVDIYGHANSTHLMGTRMVNTIGGAGDYMRNGYLSIFTMPSTAKDCTISRIVPMVSHGDHSEHDWHVLITEHGIADLRGLSPRERAKPIITQCSHPSYRHMLLDYYERAQQKKGHSPHLLEEALSWHVRYLQTGTMIS